MRGWWFFVCVLLMSLKEESIPKLISSTEEKIDEQNEKSLRKISQLIRELSMFEYLDKLTTDDVTGAQLTIYYIYINVIKCYFFPKKYDFLKTLRKGNLYDRYVDPLFACLHSYKLCKFLEK